MIQKNDVFVDTSGWAAQATTGSQEHTLLAPVYKRLIANKQKLWTTNYVLSELIALLTTRSRATRPQILQFVKKIRQLQRLTIIHITPEIDNAAWSMLEKYSDKNWSLVDAASFVVMQQQGISDALTTDHHFEQIGFHRLT